MSHPDSTVQRLSRLERAEWHYRRLWSEFLEQPWDPELAASTFAAARTFQEARAAACRRPHPFVAAALRLLRRSTA